MCALKTFRAPDFPRFSELNFALDQFAVFVHVEHAKDKVVLLVRDSSARQPAQDFLELGFGERFLAARFDDSIQLIHVVKEVLQRLVGVERERGERELAL